MSPGFSIGLLVTDDDIDVAILDGWPRWPTYGCWCSTPVRRSSTD